MYLKLKRREKISNLTSIPTSKEVEAPSTDDLSESDSDVDEIEELRLFEEELELEQNKKREFVTPFYNVTPLIDEI